MGSLQPITSNQKLIIIKVIMEVQEKYRTIENTKETEEESNLVESYEGLDEEEQRQRVQSFFVRMGFQIGNM